VTGFVRAGRTNWMAAAPAIAAIDAQRMTFRIVPPRCERTMGDQVR
jgi:hypothetical protein